MSEIVVKPLFTIDDVKFSIDCDPEDPSWLANSFDNDEEIINDIKKQIRKGNDWAWCTIIVTARFKDFEGKDYLGGCSYGSEQNFIDADDYYQDMKKTAFDNLVEAANITLKELLSCFIVESV